jgi:predicted aconitase with swiveling domain
VPDARRLTEGTARAEALRLDEPLSLWGGVDPLTGRIIDRRHPQADASVRDRVIVMPSGRGSSSSSSVLAECLRTGTGPAAILLREADPILVLGALVARELYGVLCPIAVVDHETYDPIRNGDAVEVDCSGPTARVRSWPSGQGARAEPR